ncbi:hypothetical protein SEUCBS139899_002875 [Sporothrix eucalyptigena]
MAASDSGPVAELVENPLGVPFAIFMDVFTAELEPILLAQPGLISIMTGFVMPCDSGREPATAPSMAVSLTQWESLAAHSAFLASPAAQPFFQRVQPLTAGPPTIQHFRLGHLAPRALGSSYSHICKSDVPGHSSLRAAVAGHVHSHGKEAGVMGPCTEDTARAAAVLFGDHTVADSVRNPGDWAAAYTVSWQRNTVKRRSHSL